MDLDVFAAGRADRRSRLADLLYRTGLLVVAWVVAPWVVNGVLHLQDVLELCGRDPAPAHGAAVLCPTPRVVTSAVQIVLGALPLAVFAVAARRPRRAGEPWMVLAGVLACWLSTYPLYVLTFTVMVAVLGVP